MNLQETESPIEIEQSPVELVTGYALKLFAPPPDLTVSQWADEYLYLSPEDSAEPGKFSTARAPYQRGMMDAVSNPEIKEVVYCTSSQIGKTLISKAILGYHIHQDPGPLLVMQPTTSVAETFSKDRLAPMVRDTPVLRSLIADPKSRTSGNTVLKKGFPGGHLTMVGSNAPSELASRPIRTVFADEVDRYPTSVGTEGDPLFLARQRSVTFWNRKFIMASTPTNLGASRIWRAFETSDQRYYWVPCPHCGEFHKLRWENMLYENNDPGTARMRCPLCLESYGDAEKLRMLHKGEWRAEATSRGIAGFHISALYSPWQSFGDVVNEWLAKKDNPETLKTFINLQLGECYEDRSGDTIDAHELMARRESWDYAPSSIVCVTAGVDVQDDRLEVSIIGWSGSEQAFVLNHHVLHGAPGESDVWAELDHLLQVNIDLDDGRILRIRSAAIDSGGHHTSRAYEFARTRTGRRIVPIKGRPGNHPIWPLQTTRTKLSKGVSLYMVGVDTAKDAIKSAFAVRDDKMPRYVSFSDALPDVYFKQLTVEKRHTTISKSGHSVRSWRKPPGARNEALDCYVYALAALEFLKARGLKLRHLAVQWGLDAGEESIPETKKPDQPPATVQTKQATVSKSSYVI